MSYSPNDESEDEYYIDEKLMPKAERSIGTSFRCGETLSDITSKHIIALQKIINKYNLKELDMLKQCNKEINRYINNNPEVNSINTKDLNATIYINGYVFCKIKGKQ
ncbi:hypothetical protein EIN_467480, partial [Entamoeba invadens IP1]